MPTLTEQFSSNNDEIVTSVKYAGDYTVPGTGTLDNATTAIKLLQSKNLMAMPVETVFYRQNQNGTNKRYLDGVLTIYHPTWPKISNTRRLELAAPVSTLIASTTNGTFTYDAAYKPLGSFVYDAYGNVSEQSKDQDMVTSYMYDDNRFLPVAEIKNANSNMIAYTPFGSNANGGGWTITNAGQTNMTGRSTNWCYNLTTANTISISSLPAGTDICGVALGARIGVCLYHR